MKSMQFLQTALAELPVPLITNMQRALLYGSLCVHARECKHARLCVCVMV